MTASQETLVTSSPTRPNRKRRLALFIIAALAVGTFFLVRTLIPAFRYVAIRQAYTREVHAIQDRFEQLKVTKPVTHEEFAWNGAIGWLRTATGNVFFTPESRSRAWSSITAI